MHISQTIDDEGGLYASNRGHGVLMTDGVYNMRFYRLRNNNNCANFSGTCGEFRCYGSPYDNDIDNSKEESEPDKRTHPINNPSNDELCVATKNSKSSANHVCF